MHKERNVARYPLFAMLPLILLYLTIMLLHKEGWKSILCCIFTTPDFVILVNEGEIKLLQLLLQLVITIS